MSSKTIDELLAQEALRQKPDNEQRAQMLAVQLARVVEDHAARHAQTETVNADLVGSSLDT